MPGSSGLPGPAGFGRGTQSAASLAAANALPTNARQTSNAIAAATGARGRGAPPLATAAPTGNNKYTFTGLCDALNAYEQGLVKDGTVTYANQYVIEFAPASLRSSGVTLPGTSDKKLGPMQQTNTAKDKVLPETNTYNTKAKNIAVSQGTQIIQFIEMTMRNSRYVTDQLIVAQDQLSGNALPSTSTTTNKTTTWFKITVNAVPIGDKIDELRNDYAYKITYTISTYALNEAQSQYFPEAQFRGVQKVYNYWFTGENTQVLSYEQNYNNQYINVLSSKTKTQGSQGLNNALANSVGYGIGPNKNVPSPRSGQSDQQAQNGANNPASTLADYLYSFADQSEITLQIIGDPAWLVQGEVKGLTASAFQFTGFYSDGTVNPDTQQVVFAVNWNAPADYNNGTSGPYSGTGLMDVNASATQNNNNNLSSSPTQASAAYTATEVKSTFSKGKFTQELKGNALKNLNPTQLASVPGVTRAPTPTSTLSANQPQAGTRTSLLQQIEAAGSQILGAVTNALTPSSWTSPITNTPVSAPASATPAVAPPVQPASAPTDVTSAGVVVGAASATSAVLNAGTVVTSNTTSTTTVTGGGSTIRTSTPTVYVNTPEFTTGSSTQPMAAKDA